MKKLGISIAALAAAGMMATAPAAEAAGVKLGVLSCQVESGWGYVLGSQKDIYCTFSPEKGAPERFTGDITKIGVDIGYTRGGVIIWGVLAPSRDMKADALEGSYGGVSASATIAVGGGANVLLGGFDKSITLQPISLEGNTGLNLAAGITGLQLKHVKQG